MINILLIQPDYSNQTWVTSDEGASTEVIYDTMPLGLATVAALTPDDFDVDIWDERIKGQINSDTIFSKEYNLVGVTGLTASIIRCKEIASIFRKKGIPVAVGGPGVSGRPYAWRKEFDILFIGESEITWPKFLNDWKSGKYQSEYRQIEKPELSDSPIPKWDSIVPDINRYSMGCVQTTRGCPYDCEFCDVIYLFGRRPRHKPVDRVLEEVRTLKNLGMTKIFFSDDEFTGDPAYAKELLEKLIPLNKSFSTPLSFSTHASMNVSKNDRLLELLSGANFDSLIIGVETPNKESLKEAKKYQNLREDPIGDIHKILSYGIPILAGIIVGFDNDTPDIFDMQYDFIQKAFIPTLSINTLKAAIGTRLWMRLRKEGRVLDISGTLGKGHIRSFTNIVPKNMSRVELMEGFCELICKVHTWESFGERIRGFVSLPRRTSNNDTVPMIDDELMMPLKSLNLQNNERQALEQIVTYTADVAPNLMEIVITLIKNHYRHKQIVDDVVSEVRDQIKLEKSGKVNYPVDSRPLVIPESFRKSFDSIFREVYGKVSQSLIDKSHISTVLLEIFVDFIVRWGKSFDELKDFHLSFLNELCDRSCAKYNGKQPEEYLPDNTQDTAIPKKISKSLKDDILKSVEQEILLLAANKN
jgi:radical SAM superfamily enzyme YgiQ (UPF0313 family)